MTQSFLGTRKILEAYKGTQRIYFFDSEGYDSQHLRMSVPETVLSTDSSASYIGETLALNLFNNKDFAMECYARLATSGKTTGGSILCFRKSGNNLWEFGLDLLNNTAGGKTGCRLWLGDSVSGSILEFDTSLWHHYAVTHTSTGDYVVYIDGESKLTGNYTINRNGYDRFNYITYRSSTSREITETSSFKFYDSVKYTSNFVPSPRIT